MRGKTICCLLAVLVAWAGGGTSAWAGATAGLLAVSWQPAFCEGHSHKRECESQTAERYDASHFSLHGLWPMGNNYCGVSTKLERVDKSGNWLALPALDLEPATRQKLEQVMPGYQSGLQRHEWIKHGTCSGLSEDQYFQRSIALMEALNASPVAALFSASVGAYLSEPQIRQAFEDAFGPGSADSVKMHCVRDGDRTLISEFTIGLSGAYSGDQPLGALIANAGRTGFGCKGGVVDPVGLQ